MVLPGHIAGGYLTTTALLNIFQPNFSTNEILALLIIGTLTGELPDIDLLFFNIKYRYRPANLKDSHRNYITHIPFFWLVLSMVITCIGLVFNSLFIEYLGLIILGGTWSHFILDSIEYGIRWFAPWSEKRFALKLKTLEKPTTDRPGSLMQYFHFLIRTYWKMVTFWLEIIITIIACAVYFKII